MSKSKQIQKELCPFVKKGVTPSTSYAFEKMGNLLVELSPKDKCLAIIAYTKSVFDMHDAIMNGGDDPIDLRRNQFILNEKCNNLDAAISKLFSISSNKYVFPPECCKIPQQQDGAYDYERTKECFPKHKAYYEYMINTLGCAEPHMICGEVLDL